MNDVGCDVHEYLKFNHDHASFIHNQIHTIDLFAVDYNTAY